MAQIYDGSAALSDARNGVQKRIKEEHSDAHFLYCYAHQLNLILENAIAQNTSVKVFFNNHFGIPTFFQIYLTYGCFGKDCSARLLSTRWNFKSQIVNTVLEIREKLIECFLVLEQSNSSSTGNDAAGIKRMLNDPDFLF